VTIEAYNGIGACNLHGLHKGTKSFETRPKAGFIASRQAIQRLVLKFIADANNSIRERIHFARNCLQSAFRECRYRSSWHIKPPEVWR
jgi:hypothetical protein